MDTDLLSLLTDIAAFAAEMLRDISAKVLFEIMEISSTIKYCKGAHFVSSDYLIWLLRLRPENISPAIW